MGRCRPLYLAVEGEFQYAGSLYSCTIAGQGLRELANVPNEKALLLVVCRVIQDLETCLRFWRRTAIEHASIHFHSVSGSDCASHSEGAAALLRTYERSINACIAR